MLLHPDVPRVGHDFTGVMAPDVTESEKSPPKPEPMVYKDMTLNGKILESLPVNSDRRNLMTIPKLEQSRNNFIKMAR